MNSYCVKGGVPFEVIEKIEVIKARKSPEESMYVNMDNWPEDPEQEMKKQATRFKAYLDVMFQKNTR